MVESAPVRFEASLRGAGRWVGGRVLAGSAVVHTDAKILEKFRKPLGRMVQKATYGGHEFQ
jgi:hypothetical protein